MTAAPSPSMKVPPKRKGNPDGNPLTATTKDPALNESPSEKEGKSLVLFGLLREVLALNESPSEKEGK